ncbi:unnamed protein product [Macrosiphum euphorbiae]|uniref:Uncharacterized protein n=1 Tax=Macrosiphum euphorbiae TaxID=13131 RepID=A0AAV0XD20_9HEMI|nr:unnamed protein product [Macrosiphum euphorbiae]
MTVDIRGPVQMTHTALASKEEERSGDWIDQDVGHHQENIWLKRMSSTDKFLVPPTGEQKMSSVVFDVPKSEMKSNYKFDLL